MPRLSLGLGIQNSRKVGGKSPIPRSGLSLWLKADAGVSKFSYNYASQIVISGTSNPSFAGTYTADGVPTWNYVNARIDSYSFSAPSGKQMNWNYSEVRYELFLSGSGEGGFGSYDGVTWFPLGEYISTITITGFTGIYSGANGTYNATSPNSNLWSRVGGGFFIDGDGLKDAEFESLITTPPANYSGSWTATSYDSSVTLTGAGTTSANGTYTRSDTDLDLRNVSFTASGGRVIYYSGGDWFVQNSEAENLYDNTGDLVNWSVNTGDSPAPTGSVGTSAKSVGSPTSTSVLVPTGSISGSVTTSTVNTNNVTVWADQSGNGKNATPFSSVQQTLSTFGGKSFISFPADSGLSNYDGIWTDPDLIIGTIFMVARFPSSGFATYLFRVDPTMHFGRTDESKILLSVDEIENVQSSGTMSNNINYLIGATFDTNNLFLYLNGVNDGSGAGQTQVGSPPYLVGGYANPSSIAEVVVYNRVLTTPERQQVEAYLNTKYAIY